MKRYLSYLGLFFIIIVIGCISFFDIEAGTALSWPNKPDVSGKKLLSPINSTVLGSSTVTFRWEGEKHDNRLYCWEYRIHISKQHDGNGYPTGPIRINAGTTGSDWESKQQVFFKKSTEYKNIRNWVAGAAAQSFVNYNDLPGTKIRITGVPEGKYYWTVYAISEGQGWYHSGAYPTRHTPPFYGNANYSNWNGSVYRGGNINSAWYEVRYEDCGTFYVDTSIHAVDMVWDGPIPYKDIDFTNKRTEIYATWSAVEDLGSGISKYQFKIRRLSPSPADVVSWRDVPLVNGKNTCSLAYIYA
jgi:hypothetical protein